MASSSDEGWVIPPRWWRWIGTRRTAVVLLWLVCFAYAGQRLHRAWTAFDSPADAPPDQRRADGNEGHAQIDFGGQWLAGRMVVTGHARELYHRNEQWKLAWEGFPPEGESPFNRRNAGPRPLRDPSERDAELRHDAEWLMHWVMGTDSPRWGEATADAMLPLTARNPVAAAVLIAVSSERLTPELVAEVNRPTIGGPLYPPVQAFLYAPLALDDRPQRAYHTFQILSVLVTFVAGLGVRVLSRGWVWWPAATLIIFLYPGYRAGLDLAQNQVFTLAILVWGWVLASRGRDGWGGMVWGLLAFKPVWAAAFFLAPLLMRRWKFCTAMVGTGAALGAATLPFVGLQAWFDWLAVGREASGLYLVEKNWIQLSRDLFGIPRRVLIDFTLPIDKRNNPLAGMIGWALWLLVFVPTIGLYLWRGDRRPTGLAAGFLFLGAYLCCYRFMYYDVLLSVLPLAVLFADPRRFFRPTVFELRPLDAPRPSWVVYLNSFPLTVVAVLILVENWLLHVGPEATFALTYFSSTASDTTGETIAVLPTLTMDVTLLQPWETLILLALWLWCGYQLLRKSDRDPATS